MIKLSNQQIKAVCNRIYEELTAPISEHNQKIYESEEYKHFFETHPDCLLLKRLSEEYEFSYIQSHLEKIRSVYFKNKFFTKYFSLSSIENELHLATIDASDLNTLIQTVVSKFK